MTTRQDPNAGWTRLEDVLTATKPGETVSIDALVAETGLTLETVTTVMNELTRIDLFRRVEEKVFVRRRLWPQAG